MFLIPHLGSGGAERVLKNLTDGFKECENYVVLFENVVKHNVNGELIILNSPASKSFVKKLINFPIRCYKIRKLKREIKPYAVISLLEPANFYNAITKLKNQKVILSLHSNYTSTLKEDPFFGDKITRKILYFAYKFAFKIFYNSSDYIVAVSKGIALDAIRNFGMSPEKMVVIYNPHPIENIEELAKEDLREWKSVFESPVIITAGRLTKPKGQWYLLRVFRQLKETYKDLKLVILGEGELKEYLVKLSEELGLRTFVWDRDSFSEDFDVYFLGFQKNPFKFIARSKLFVFPSLWEGFPNALVEAMVCGVPVVSSDCRSGPREILAPSTDVEYQTEKPEFAEYGVLMPNFEAKFKSAKEPLGEKEIMWLEVLEKILQDEELRKCYSVKGKRRVEDFSLKKIAEEWKRLLEFV